MKKEWGTPELRDLSVDLTNAIEYVDYCNWVPIDGIQRTMEVMIQQ